METMDEGSRSNNEKQIIYNAPEGIPARLVLSPLMSVEQMDAATATIYLRSNGARVRVPRSFYDLLLKFEAPQSAAFVAGSPRRNQRLSSRPVRTWPPARMQ